MFLSQSLKGLDGLAEVPNSSGNTLEFVVSVLQHRCRELWIALDGIGALILIHKIYYSMKIFVALGTVTADDTDSDQDY